MSNVQLGFFLFRSPQTRATIGGMVPLVPASDAVKENTSTAPALPSPAAILPDQPCIEAEVGLATRKATSPQQILESMKTVRSLLVNE